VCFLLSGVRESGLTLVERLGVTFKRGVENLFFWVGI